MSYANTDAISAHLFEISQHVSSDVHAILVVDGAGWRRSRDLVAALKPPPCHTQTAPGEAEAAAARTPG